MSGLEIKDISLNIDGNKILENISATVQEGETVGLIGPNGAGKSCLLKSTLGLLDIKAGTINIDDKNIAGLDLKDRAKKMAYAAQGAPVYWPLTALTVVGLGRVPHLNPWQKLSNDDEIAIEYAMERTDCLDLKDRLVTTLSGGERARVLLARVLATGAKYILADEPVAALDPSHQLQIMNILSDLSKNGHGVLVVLHDLNHALRYCDRIILLNEGKVVGQDIPEQILNDQNLKNIFGISAARWSENGHQFISPLHIQNGS